MASSDEEGEIWPDLVTNYELINDKNDHVSFACLPLHLGKDEIVKDKNARIFLSGTCNDGLDKLYKQVLAWRYEISYPHLEIALLLASNHWIRLLKPKKTYEPAIRSIMVTIQSLHFLKHNPEMTEESMWGHLSKVFSTYAVAPSELDYMNHVPLIRVATENDKDLASSEFLVGILSEQPRKRSLPYMEGLAVKGDGFIVDEVVEDSFLHDESCEEEELFDTCCSLCDNGGDILFCEGRCMRSFHATNVSGQGSCGSLGLTEAYVNAVPNFFCKNCQYQQHQCFLCGKLGSSDVSSNAEVFPCVSASCGRFYHPSCVAAELQKRNDTQMDELEKKIAAGESFVCPAHKCFVCKEVENRKDYSLQFAVCRRCPKSYHRKCLPREIAFANDDDKKILPRAWDDLLPKRILLYCLDHEIIRSLGTPRRNHIRFPGTDNEETGSLGEPTGESDFSKKRKLIQCHRPAEDSAWKTEKLGEKPDFSSRKSGPLKLVIKGLRGPEAVAQRKSNLDAFTSTSSGHKKFPKEYGSSVVPHGKSMLASSDSHSLGLDPALLKKKSCSSPVVDLEMKRRIIALIEEADSSFNIEEFKKKLKVPFTYKHSQDLLDKNLTKGKVEVTVKAIRTAVQNLNNGGTIDEAKSVCSPEVLRQMPLWKRKLEIYLGPFLHGTRYQSFGRHFTKLEKLQEVVDRLHSYVQNGDMIVDFCCGANDFSSLMKEKLDGVGKKCFFKNYDLFPSKNGFNFENRDWYSVQPKELPDGSQLVMGLNPPFGVKGALANQFINHALKFKPKLLILIVPPETRRLDTRNNGKRYDLVWEDQHLLSGKSFYLPGSIDTDDKQISQWNNVAPPLFLWSRPDWTRKHMEIARRCHHVWGRMKPPSAGNYLREEQQDCYGDLSGIMNQYGNLPSMPGDVPESGGCDLGPNNELVWEAENVASFSDASYLEDMDISS